MGEAILSFLKRHRLWRDKSLGISERNIPYWHDFENRDVIREFIAYFFFVGWWAISFGLHVDLKSPNIEIHVPFGFIRIGFCRWELRDDGTITNG